MMLQLMAFDDAGNWNEADHPRDESGKFTKGGAVTASLAKAGWKKTAENDKVTQYVGPAGDTLQVNKETGAFGGFADGKYVTGIGKADLPTHLQKGGDGTSKASFEKALAGMQSQASAPMTQKQQDYIVNSHVGKIIGAAGFKKAGKTDEGELQFVHPSGATIVIHAPAADKKSSSEWTHFKSDGDEEGQKGVGIALAKVLGQAVQKAEAKKAEAPTNQQTKPMTLNDAGFKAKGIDGDWHSFETPNGTVAMLNNANGKWSISGGHAGAGGLHGLNQKLGELYGGMEPAPKAPTAAPPPKHADLPAGKAEGTADVKSFLTDKGYDPTPEKTDYGTFKFVKPNGAEVELDPKTGDWIASTPGHMKKEGNGANSLATLLSGKPAVFKAGESPPWKNTTKANLDPAAAQKAAAQEAEVKKLAGQANATQDMLMKAAPEPTPSEAKAATKYTGSAYMSWNNSLRHDPDFVDKDTLALDSYLAKSEVPEDVTVYRKVSGEYSKILKSILIEGTKFVDHGYVSTSTHQGTWSGDMQWVITLKKGQKGASVKKLSKFSSENEVLLPRSTAFIVKKFDRKAGLVHVEVDQSHLEHKWKVNA